MQAGTLDKRATIQRQATGEDEIGQPVPTWENVITDTTDGAVWASLRYVSGLETIKSSADVSIVKASIRIRRRAGITAGMRVLVGGVVYDIQAVLPNTQYIDLACQVVA